MGYPQTQGSALGLGIATAVVAAILVAASGVARSAGDPYPHRGTPVPKTVVLDGRTLSSIASQLHAGKGTPAQIAALEQLRTLADKDAHFGAKTVVGGPGAPAPEYYSQAPYWGQCTDPPGGATPPPRSPPCTKGATSPNCPNGYPYWQFDGQRNPEIKQYPDHQHQVDTWRAVSELSLAWFYASRLPAGSDGSHLPAKDYAKHAVLLLHTWFIAPRAKAQSPDFTFAQTIPCRTVVRGEGVLDATASLTQLLDAIALLDSGAPGNGWTAADSVPMRTWLTNFQRWMLTSPQGMAESKKLNNHGSWKALGDAALAAYLHDPADLRTAVMRGQQLIEYQIKPDGEQWQELSRTKPWHYSNYNATPLCRLAELAQQIPGQPVAIWHYTSHGVQLLPKAIDYLIPGAEHGDAGWPHRKTATQEKTIEKIRYLAYYELHAAATQAGDPAAKMAVHTPPPKLQMPPPPPPAPKPNERGNLWDVAPDCEVLNG